MTMPIIVSVDGSTLSYPALAWAAREAELRDVPLHILHAAGRWEDSVLLASQPAAWDEYSEAAARKVLARAEARARTECPHVRITTAIVDGRAEQVLVSAAKAAQLVIVGNRGGSGFAELLLGSVSRYVATRASCSVVVVREPAAGGEVVVGVSGQPHHDHVLDCAFREAGWRGLPLRAVHAWRHPTPHASMDLQSLIYDVEAVGEEERRLFAETLIGWRQRFPDVPLIEHVVHQHPAKALIEASRAADLVVIGAREGMRTLLGLGATAHAVLHHAHAPVLVARPRPQESAPLAGEGPGEEDRHESGGHGRMSWGGSDGELVVAAVGADQGDAHRHRPAPR